MIAQPPHITQLLLDLRRPKQLKGCIRLFELASASGVAILTGGVRGWAEALGCGLSYPKILFAELEALEIIAGVEYFPGEGGQVAEVHLLQPDSITDQRERTFGLPAAGDASHADAVDEAPDRSLIVPPRTPHVDDHESMQQQHAHVRENSKPDSTLTRFLLREVPGADVALLNAWEANPQVNDCKAARDALISSPGATLADWRADLAAAEDRPSTAWPVGLVLACWARGERVTPRRTPPVVTPTPRQRDGRAGPSAPRAPSLPNDREIREDTELLPGDRDAFLAQYAAAPDDTARAEVLCAFRRAWATRYEADLVSQQQTAAPAGYPPASSIQLRQIWQAAMGACQTKIARQEFDAWLRGSVLLAFEGGTATVLAPSQIHKEGLERRHLILVRRSLGDVIGAPVQVRVVVEGGP